MERLEVSVQMVQEVGHLAYEASHTYGRLARVEKPESGARNGNELANEAKDMRKTRLRRLMLQEPQLARELVATEASPVYNAKGELIPTLGTGQEMIVF